MNSHLGGPGLIPSLVSYWCRHKGPQTLVYQCSS